MTDYVTLVVPIISATIAAISLTVAIRKNHGESDRASAQSIAALEHRLTVLEQNQFTPEDRKCLHELTFMTNKLWGTVENEFPRFLKHKHTMVFDLLLDKAWKMGIGSLSKTEKVELGSMLEEEYEKAVVAEDAGRAFALALYKEVFKIKAEGHITNACGNQ